MVLSFRIMISPDKAQQLILLFWTTRFDLNGRYQVKLKIKRKHTHKHTHIYIYIYIYTYLHTVSYAVEISKPNDWFVLCCVHNIGRIALRNRAFFLKKTG